MEEEIKELKEKVKFYQEWDDFYKREIAERNRKAWEVLAKYKNVKEIELINLSEIDVWTEIDNLLQKVFLEKGVEHER